MEAALPGRLCERGGAGGEAWSRDVPASVLDARRQQVEAALSVRGPFAPQVPSLAEGLQGSRGASRQVEGLLETYARELRADESAERLSAIWLEILHWTGVRGVRPEALSNRGLGEQLAGLGSIAQTPNAVRSRLLRGERGYVSVPVLRGELTNFPPHLLDLNRGPLHRDFNRKANQILGERESVALLRMANSLGRSPEDRRLRDRLEVRLSEVERAVVAWGGRRSGRGMRSIESTKNAEAARRFVTRSLAGRLRQAERGLAQGLVRTAAAVALPRLPGLGLLAKANAVAGWAQEIGQAVLVIEAAVRREQGLASRRRGSPLEQVAAGDVSTYRLLRLTSGHPKAVARFRDAAEPSRDLPGAVREYRRRRAELVRFARTCLREGRPPRETGGAVAQRAAAVLSAREQVVNAGLQRLGIPNLRMLAGTARDHTQVLARFTEGCRTAGMSVGTAVRVVAEIGPVVLGGFLAGAALTLASRLVMKQVFGLGRDLAKEFLYGERDRGR